MAYPKKPGGAACRTVQVDQETFNLIEQLREKSESKGEAIKRLIFPVSKETLRLIKLNVILNDCNSIEEYLIKIMNEGKHHEQI